MKNKELERLLEDFRIIGLSEEDVDLLVEGLAKEVNGLEGSLDSAEQDSLRLYDETVDLQQTIDDLKDDILDLNEQIDLLNNRQ